MHLRILQHLPIWLLCIVHGINSEIPEDWVDPHDMSPSADYLPFADGQLPLHDYYKARDKGSSNCNCDLSEKKFQAYLKRTINLLLNAVHEDNFNADMYSGHLFFKIEAKHFETLRNFANGFDKSEDLVKIDAILSELLTKPTDKHVQEFLESYFHKFLNVLLTKEGIITVICCAYLYVIYQMFLADFYWRYVMCFLFFNLVIFDFVFTWIHLYKKAEIEKMTYKAMYKDLPVQCNPEKLDSWQFFWNVFSREDTCKKYHEVNYQDIFWTISPGLVVSEMFSDLVEGPLLMLGSAFSGTCRQIYDAIPWPFNIIIFPVALIFLCILISIILTFLFRGSVKLNLFHMFSFTVSGHNPPALSDYRLTHQRIEELPYRESPNIRASNVQTGQNNLQIKNTPRNNVRLEHLSNDTATANANVETTTVKHDTVRDKETESDVAMRSEESGDNSVCNTKNQRKIDNQSTGGNITASGDANKKESEQERKLVDGGGDCS